MSHNQSVMPVKTGIQMNYRIPGFRVVLAIASPPGMTNVLGTISESRALRLVSTV
jgi:hypothetical protein